MPEPTKQTSERITISPDDPRQVRSWPDPRDPREILWRARNAQASLSSEDIAWLGQRASAYAHIFDIPHREFLPTHAAIRAHLSQGHGTGG